MLATMISKRGKIISKSGTKEPSFVIEISEF